MRTVGEILKKTRWEKKLTLEEIENKTKIRKKYLQALEENAWSKLPSLPYIKGFLRNYSEFLDLDSYEILAIFRRQYQFEDKTEVLPEGIANPLNQPALRLTPQTIVLLIFSLLLLIFFIYLGLQYKAVVSPPTLSIEKPQEGEVLSSASLEIRGKTDTDATLEINNKKIALLENGEFKATFSVQPGVNTIVFEAISKYGKKKTVTRTITYEEKLEQ